MTDNNRYGDWVLAGRVWYNTKTGQSLPVIQGGALPYTDNFTAADDTLLTTYSADWTMVAGTSPRIFSNAISPNATDADFMGYLNSDTPNNNQYAEMVFTSQTNNVDISIGPAVRASTSALTDYHAYTTYQSSTWRTDLFKVVAGSFESLGNVAQTFTAGGVVRIEASGDSITVKYDGSTIIGPVTNSDISSGRLGMAGYNNAPSTLYTSWTGGDLVVSGITGTVNTTLESVTLSSLGKLTTNANLSKTLGNIIFSSSGLTNYLGITGTLNKTLDDITKSSFITSAIYGNLNKTLDNISFSSSGTIPNIYFQIDDIILEWQLTSITANFSKTLDNVVFSSNGIVTLESDLSKFL